MPVFKIYFSKDNIRRIKLSSLPNYLEFTTQLKSTYQALFQDKKFLIKYIDSDGDKIAVSTQVEWEEMLSVLRENGYKIILEFIEEEIIEKNDVFSEEELLEEFENESPLPKCMASCSEEKEKEKEDGKKEEEEFGCPFINFFVDCPVKRWMGCSKENGNSNKSCWSYCESACPLNQCETPFLSFLVPLISVVFGFCPLVSIGCLVFRFSRIYSSADGFPVKMICCLLLVPCLLRYCPLIWVLVIGLSLFIIKKGICSFIKERKKSQLINNLHRIALDCLDSGDVVLFQNAKEILQRILKLSPNDIIALYNLACAESLLGNEDEALENLEKAIDAGYGDVNHMKSDRDFNNIRNTEGFKKLEKKLENILFSSRLFEKVVEEPREEIKEDKMDKKG